jgi:hypothetical protein
MSYCSRLILDAWIKWWLDTGAGRAWVRAEQLGSHAAKDQMGLCLGCDEHGKKNCTELTIQYFTLGAKTEAYENYMR